MKSLINKRLIILTAPSGAGKTTIANALLKKFPNLGFTVSATTRLPRGGEINGRDYYFLSVPDFKQKISEDAFIEYEMVYPGKYYGTLNSELQRIWGDKRTPLRVVDVLGAVELKKEFESNSLAIFIQPPSLEILHRRLELRKTDDEKAIGERIKRAAMEMQYASHFYHVIVNNQLEIAIQEVTTLVSDFIKESDKKI
ncbi:MAG: guanylate kinase [Chitinophagaceae bacterium]